ALRVAMTAGDDLGRPARAAVLLGREGEELAVERVRALRQRAVPRIARRHVQPAVGAEGDASAVVDRSGLDAVDQRPLAAEAAAGVAPALEPHPAGGREVEVDEAVARELGIDGEAEQAA